MNLSPSLAWSVSIWCMYMNVNNSAGRFMEMVHIKCCNVGLQSTSSAVLCWTLDKCFESNSPLYKSLPLPQHHPIDIYLALELKLSV